MNNNNIAEEDWLNWHWQVQHLIRTKEDYERVVDFIIRDSISKGQNIVEIRTACDSMVKDVMAKEWEKYSPEEGLTIVLDAINKTCTELEKEGIRVPKVSCVVLASRSIWENGTNDLDGGQIDRQLDALLKFASEKEYQEKYKGIGLGFDIAGSEDTGLPPADFTDIYGRIFEHNQKSGVTTIGTTIHSSETPVFDKAQFIDGKYVGGRPGYDAAKEAAENLPGLERVGHGLQIVLSAGNVEFIKDSKVSIEICPTCNIVSIPVNFEAIVENGDAQLAKEHPVETLLKTGIPCVIATDNALMCATDINMEYIKLIMTGHDSMMNWNTMKEIARNGIMTAFISEADKEQLLKEFDLKVTKIETLLTQGNVYITPSAQQKGQLPSENTGVPVRTDSQNSVGEIFANDGSGFGNAMILSCLGFDIGSIIPSDNGSRDVRTGMNNANNRNNSRYNQIVSSVKPVISSDFRFYKDGKLTQAGQQVVDYVYQYSNINEQYREKIQTAIGNVLFAVAKDNKYLQTRKKHSTPEEELESIIEQIVSSIDKGILSISPDAGLTINDIIMIGAKYSPEKDRTKIIKAMEAKGFVEYNPLTDCVQIATQATALMVFGDMTTNVNASVEDTFISTLKAAGIVVDAAEKAVKYIMERVAHKAVIADLEQIDGMPKGGMEIILNGLNKDTNHAVAIKDIKDGVVTYVANIKRANGKMLTGQISIQDLEKGVYITEDGLLKPVDRDDVVIFKFNGQALVSAADSMNAGINDIVVIQKVFGIKDKTMASMDKDFVKLLGNIIKAMSNPDTSSKEVQAVWNLANKNIKGLAQLLNFDSVESITKEEIIKRTIQKMLEISAQQSERESLMAVELTAVAGGLLYAMKDQKVSNIADLNKLTPKNQMTIVSLIRKEYDKSVSNRKDDFVINISQLQKDIKTKIGYTKEEREKILDILTGLIDDKENTKEKVGMLMKLSDIHAIAASA